MAIRLVFQNTGVVPSTADGPIRMDGPSLTLGRGVGNDVVLPDPDRMISKNHCVIEDRGGSYVVIDLSTNGTFLNYSKQPLGNVPTPLNHGDTLSFGGFELVVEIDSAAPTASVDDFGIPPPLDEKPAPPVGTASAGQVGAVEDDFLDEFLGTSTSSKSHDQLIPDDPFETGGIGHGAGYIPDDFDLGLDSTSSSQRHHTDAPGDFYTPPAVHSSQIPDDLDLGGEPSPPAATPPQPEPETPPAAAATPSAAPAEDDAASRAFLKAAGVEHLDITDEELAETMERLGEVFQTMVTGMRELLMTRVGRHHPQIRAMKNEFRMGQTTIGSTNNNPLKFSISPEQALEAMTKPPSKGYLEPTTAAKEALDDIKAHEVAILTGMEAALKSILAKLDPKALEGQIESSGLLGKLLKGKKAQYWEVYEKLYSEIASQAEEDFQEIFGKEFAAAYQDQIKKL